MERSYETRNPVYNGHLLVNVKTPQRDNDFEPAIIFHVPWKLLDVQSASQLRPVKMINAFRLVGYDVTVVSGDRLERRRIIDVLKRKIRTGINYEFCYSESSTLPTLFASGRKHFLRAGFVDFRLFLFLRRHKIPLGLFLRDIYWRFSSFRLTYRSSTRWALFFLGYSIDAIIYRLAVRVLFLPSLHMRRYLPTKLKSLHTRELPPGIDYRNEQSTDCPSIASRAYPGKKLEELRLVYVGGIGAHYRLHTLVSAVGRASVPVKLVLIVRQHEWESVVQQYAIEKTELSRVIVKHQRHDQLPHLYLQSDVSMIFVEPTVYWSFAMPYKLFEYLKFRLPVVVSKGTAAGDFVDRNDVGWTIPYTEDALLALMEKLFLDPQAIAAKTTRIEKILKQHSWEARARYVVTSLQAGA